NPSKIVGIEPSKKNCNVAEAKLKGAEITCTDLFAFDTDEKFDYVFMILASDYFQDLVPMFEKLRSFLNDGGKLITIDPDYEYNKTERLNYDLTVEPTSDNEYIVSVTRPSGTMVGFVRKNDYLVEKADDASLSLAKTVEIQPTDDFMRALPQYEEVKHLSIAQLNMFEAK
ncbi:MAG TPA: class I SAM-dependent methyltransferase, partial [Patescibacteria group bacterium]|nr:class I SAM-dependent methyltransferase [Patescibacteria group bacterium]